MGHRSADTWPNDGPSDGPPEAVEPDRCCPASSRWIGLRRAFPDPGHRRSVILLVACWLGGAGALATYGTVSAHLGGPEPSFARAAPVDLDEGTAAFTACRRTAGGTRIVKFDRSWTSWEGSPPEKVVHIERLTVTSLLGSVAAPSTSRPAWHDVDPWRVLEGFEAEPAGWNLGPALADAAAIRIRGLDWQVSHDGRIVLRLRCDRAVFRAERAGIRLLGQVVVRTADALLEADALEVHPRRGHLLATGDCRLTRDGDTQRGADGRFDADLRPACGDPSAVGPLTVSGARSSETICDGLPLTGDRGCATLKVPNMEGHVRATPFTGWHSRPQEAAPERPCAAQAVQPVPEGHQHATEYRVGTHDENDH